MLNIGPTSASLPQIAWGSSASESMTKQDTTVKMAAKGFEESLIVMLLKEMRGSLGESSLFSHDSGDVMGGMFDQFMAKHLVQAGGLGLTPMISRQLEMAKHHEPPKQQPRTT